MKMDRKLVSAKQRYEISYVARKFSLPTKRVIEIMLLLGKDGKFCRSRIKIEKYIISEMQKEIVELKYKIKCKI